MSHKIAAFLLDFSHAWSVTVPSNWETVMHRTATVENIECYLSIPSRRSEAVSIAVGRRELNTGGTYCKRSPQSRWISNG